MRALGPLVAALFFALAPGFALAGGGIDFAAARAHGVGVLPRDAAAADLDGDGDLDLAVTSLGDDVVSVLFGFGDGRGGFADAVRVAAGDEPEGLGIADFDGDGVLDLAVAASRDGSVLVLRGDGVGGFSLLGTSAAGSRPQRLGVADVDSDGFPDVIVVNGTPNVHVLLGDGAGGFRSSTPFGVGRQPLGLAVADFDGDGLADFATANYGDDSVSTRLGLGGGLFAAPTTLRGVVAPFDVAAADLDRDGRVDLAVASSGDGRIVLFAGDGAGGFSPSGDGLAGLSSPRAVSVADLDGDGRLDLAIALLGARNVRTFSGDGRFAFSERTAASSWDVPKRIVVADLNGDGAPDLAAPNEQQETGAPGSVTIFLNPGDGRFPAPPLFATGRSAFAIAVADFDEDGVPDVATAGIANPPFVSRGDGSGGFLPPASLFVPAAIDVRALVAADLDGDAHADLLLSGAVDSWVFSGDGAGGFGAPASLPISGLDALAADFDADGRLDLAFVDRRTTRIALGAGGGTFAAALAVGPPGYSIAAADFDGNGRVDLAVRDDFPAETTILFGDGTGGVGASMPLSSGLGDLNAYASQNALVAGDLDGDGNADVAGVALRDSSSVLFAFFGDGAGAFSLPATADVEARTLGLVLANPDRDGRTEILTLNRTTKIGVTRFRSDRTLERCGAFSGGKLVTDAASADLDGDGRDDLAIVSSLIVFPEQGGVVLLERGESTIRDGACRAGNVGLGSGAPEDVLLVNGGVGAGPLRHVTVDSSDPIRIRMLSPLSIGRAGPARFALYAFPRPPASGAPVILPRGVGSACATLFAGGSWRRCWNNIGNRPLLGTPDFASLPAPSIVLRRDAGLRARGTFFLQGVIEDPNSPSGLYAVTNGIEIESR